MSFFPMYVFFHVSIELYLYKHEWKFGRMKSSPKCPQLFLHPVHVQYSIMPIKDFQDLLGGMHSKIHCLQ